MLPNNQMDPFFRATIDATEEAVVNAMLARRDHDRRQRPASVRVAGRQGCCSAEEIRADEIVERPCCDHPAFYNATVMTPTRSSLPDAVASDREHLLHPLHHPAAHQHARIWVEGHGAIIKDADGREYIDGLSGLWNVNVGHGRRELAEAASAQMSTLAYASSYAGSTNHRAIELAETPEHAHVPVDQRVLLHERRRRSHRHVDQDGALLLEGDRETGQGQDHLAASRRITASRSRP